MDNGHPLCQEWGLAPPFLNWLGSQQSYLHIQTSTACYWYDIKLPYITVKTLADILWWKMLIHPQDGCNLSFIVQNTKNPRVCMNTQQCLIRHFIIILLRCFTIGSYFAYKKKQKSEYTEYTSRYSPEHWTSYANRSFFICSQLTDFYKGARCFIIGDLKRTRWDSSEHKADIRCIVLQDTSDLFRRRMTFQFGCLCHGTGALNRFRNSVYLWRGNYISTFYTESIYNYLRPALVRHWGASDLLEGQSSPWSA